MAAAKKIKEGAVLATVPGEKTEEYKPNPKIKFRCDFKSWEEYNKYKGVKG